MTKVITYGTYDLFHQGHYNILKRAKELGDYLIVGVTTEHFDEARGKVNVIDPIMDRIENVRRTGFADEIIIEDHDGQKIEDIQKYGVDIFTLGSDWEGKYDYLKQFCKVVYLPRTPDISSTMLRSSKYQIVRTGIVGTGRMAPRFVAESQYVSGINIPYAFNPEVESGEEFAKKHEIECLHEDYDDFLSKVDAVYVASPNQMHYEYAKRAIEAGKHVLCEKPLAFKKEDSEKLYDMAKANNIVLLEAVKTAFCPGFQELLNVAQSGRIGEIRDIEANFTRLANPKSREYTDAKYGGSFLEFGSYTLLPIIKLLGRDYKDIRFSSLFDDNGNDMYTKVDIEFNNAFATGKTGVGVKTEGQLVISGTKGYILSESPWWLTKRFEVRYEDENKIDVFEPNFQGDGLRYEIQEFVSKINGYSKQGYKLTAGEAIAMAEFTEKFMEYKSKMG